MSEEEVILDKINSLKKDEKVQSGTPFFLPQGYFNVLNERLLSKVNTENSVASTDWQLIDSEKNKTYNVPEKYFDDFNNRLLGQIKHPVKLKWLTLWYKIAAASIIIGLISFAVFLFYKNFDYDKIADHNSKGPEMEFVNTAELTDFIEDGVGDPNGTRSDAKTIDSNQLFKNINNSELENFINENTVAGSNLF